MNKEGCLIILDLTPDLYNNSNSNLEISFKCINQLIAQFLLYYKKNDEIGLLLINSGKNTNDNNLELFLDLSPAKFFMLRNLRELYKRLLEEKIEGCGDIFLGLKESLNLMKTHFRKKKYFKKIFLITSGNSKTEFSEREIINLAENLNDYNIRTNVISIDFWNAEESDLNSDQIEIKKKLGLFSENNNNKTRIFDQRIALNILSDFRSAKLNNICGHRGTLELAPNCNLQIQVYSKTKKKNFPSLKKYSKNSKFERDIKKQNVETSKYYFNPEDAEMSEIEKNDIIKGFSYGQQIVPISKEMENLMKYKDQKCFKLLGFVDKSQIRRELYMSEIECVMPSKNSKENNIKKFNSIIMGCILNEKIGLARYVKRNNNSPKLVALIPKRKFNDLTEIYNYMFYLTELPTIEDMREYSFGSLLRSNKKQREVIGELIDKMDIKDFENKELLKCKETYNPNLQTLNQVIVEKGLNENRDPRIEMSERIENYIKVENKVYKKIEDMEEKIKNEFDLIENEIREEKPKREYWNKLLEENPELEENLIQKLKNRDDEPIVKKISNNHPISDFKEMMNYKKEDLVENAIKQMQGRILEFIKNSVDGSLFEKALECLRILKEGCIDEEEVNLFNDFLVKFKEKLLSKKNFREFWGFLKESKISVICKEEVEGSEFGREEAEMFLGDDEFFGKGKKEGLDRKVMDLADELD